MAPQKVYGHRGNQTPSDRGEFLIMEALQDLNEGFLFYEAQQIDLGDYFVSSLRSDIERLKIA